MPVSTGRRFTLRDNIPLDDSTTTHTLSKIPPRLRPAVRTKRDHPEYEEIPWIRYHGKAYCDEKAESLNAWLLIHYGINVHLTVAERHFETCSDFESDMTLIMYLASQLTENPEVCIFGDTTGVTGISCLNGLVPRKLSLVAEQSVQHHDVKNANVNDFLSVVATASKEYAGVRIRTNKQTYNEYLSTMNSDRITSHNSHPWPFLADMAKSGKSHIDVVIWQAVWDRVVLKQTSDVQDNMEKEKSSLETLYARDPDDFFNYLNFYQHETSPSEQVVFLDKFILNVMKKNRMTCDFIVFSCRGTITDANWQALKDQKSTLANEYTIVFRIEELPHTKEGHIKYNKNTGSSDVILDSHNIQPEDKNGAERGRFFQYICRRNGSVTNCKNIKYEYTDWYARYFNGRDASRQAVYVKRKTWGTPCKRISLESANNLQVLLQKEFDALTPNEKSEFTKIHALLRRIEVQIEDLKFFSVEFKQYLTDCRSNKSIDDARTRQMKVYMGQFEYRYKLNEDIKYNAQNLINTKIRLFTEVHELAFKIKELKHWKLEPIEDAPPEMLAAMDLERYNHTKTEMNSLLLQLHGKLQLDDNQYTLGNTAERNQAPEAKDEATNRYHNGVKHFEDMGGQGHHNHDHGHHNHDGEGLNGEDPGDNSEGQFGKNKFDAKRKGIDDGNGFIQL